MYACEVVCSLAQLELPIGPFCGKLTVLFSHFIVGTPSLLQQTDGCFLTTPSSSPNHSFALQPHPLADESPALPCSPRFDLGEFIPVW